MFILFKIAYSLIFFANAVAILNDKRLLSKIGLPLSHEARACLGPTRLKTVDLIKAIKTVVTIPLIGLHIVCMVYEVFLG